MTPAPTDESLLREPAPRSEATVQLYAGPIDKREQRARRVFRWYIAIVLALVGALILTHVDPVFILIVCMLGALYPGLWLALRKQLGHATELVRSGRAFAARAERRVGPRGTQDIFTYTWSDEGGREHRAEVVAPTRDAPAQVDQAIVLDDGNRHVVGVVVAGRMFVPGRLRSEMKP
jgi:hypothetical protein